jgi:hypothetical protein
VLTLKVLVSYLKTMDCCICLDGQGYFKTSCCGQLYHETCFNEWMDMKNRCPTCRRLDTRAYMYYMFTPLSRIPKIMVFNLDNNGHTRFWTKKEIVIRIILSFFPGVVKGSYFAGAVFLAIFIKRGLSILTSKEMI